MDKSNLFCKIFVNTKITKVALFNLIKNELTEEINRFEISNSTLVIELRKNNEFNILKSQNVLNGFLFYKYHLEIQPFSEVAEREYIKVVSDLLKKLWESKIEAVAACDFENALSRNR